MQQRVKSYHCIMQPGNIIWNFHVHSPLHFVAVRFDFRLHDIAVRFDSPLIFVAVRSDSLLQDAAGSHISLLQNAVIGYDSPLHSTARRFLQKSLTWFPVASFSREIWLAAAFCSGKISLSRCIMQLRGFDSPLHDAMGGQTSVEIIPQVWNQFWTKIMVWIKVQGGYFWWKKRRSKISHYCLFKKKSTTSTFL
jgi:hypothetical protein